MPTKRCNLCRGTVRFHLRCQNGTLYRCLRCEGISLYPIPPQRILNQYYGDPFYDVSAERFNPFMELLVRFFRFHRANIVCRMHQKGNVLDVGFSRGMMLTFLKQRGWKTYGITNSRNVYEYGKRIGLKVQLGDLPDVTYPTSHFSVITLWHVLEHLRTPERYLRKCHAILRDGGVLIIEVPNSASVPAAWFKCHWFGLDLPRHLSHFTPTTLRTLLHRTGFRVSAIRFFSLEHSIFSLLQSMLNALTGGGNAVFESLKKHTTIPPTRKFVHLALAVLLLPIATLLALAFALVRRGDIMRLYCVKE